DQAVGRMLQMMQEVPEEERLAVLLQPEHRVELRRRLVGQHRAQEIDVRRRNLHVDEEVGAVRGEQQRELGRVGQQRIDVKTLVRAALDRDDERIQVNAVHDAADRVRRLIAKQQAGKDLNLAVRVDDEWPRQPPAHRLQDVGQVDAKIGEAQVERQVEDEVDQRGAKAQAARIVAA